MKINQIDAENFPLVEVVSNEVLVKNTQDVLDLLGEVGFSNIILYDHNFESDFFDLSTNKLGEILQKFTNYQVKLAIIGDFEKYPSRVLKKYIHETNRVGDFLFVTNMEAVKDKWISSNKRSNSVPGCPQ